jgi:hypothetical protein
MAKTFLSEDEQFIVANDGNELIGRPGGNEGVEIMSGVSDLVLDGNIEEVEVSAAAADVELRVDNTTGQLQLVSNGTVASTFNAGLSGTVNLAFDDGNATLTQTGLTSYSLVDPDDPTNEVSVDLDNPQNADAVFPSGDGMEEVSGPGSADAAAGDVTFDFADGDYGYDIAKFDTGDTLDFADVGGRSNAVFNVLTDLDPSDGQKQVTAANPNTGGTVEVTLTGLTAEQDSAIFNQAGFVNEFGLESLIL